MSIRKPDGRMVVALTSIWWSEGEMIRRGTTLPASHPAVRSNKLFFADATLGPTLDGDAMREAERRLWAQMTASDA